MNWHKALAATQTEQEVVALAQDYVEALPRWLRCFIPRECIERPIVDPEDLVSWCMWLTNRFADAAITVEDVKVQDLVVFFIRAASRTGELGGGPSVSNTPDFLDEELLGRAEAG